MTNTYAINVTRGQEFTVERELSEIGLRPWIPRALHSRQIKERRERIWYDRPYVHKMAFCVIPPIYWTDVRALKNVIGKPIPLSRLDINGIPACGYGDKKSPARPGLLEFRRAVEAEYADMCRRRDDANWTCAYTPGQALEILDGAFADRPAVFRKAIKKSHDEFTKLRLDVDFFGRITPVDVAPSSVKAI